METIKAKTTINGNEYETTLFLGSPAVKLFHEIKKDLRDAINDLKASDIVFDDANVDLKQAGAFMIGKLIASFASSRSPSEYDDLLKRILQWTTIGGKSLSDNNTFNEHFSGKIGELHAVVLFVLQENFKDLFTIATAIDGLKR